MPDEPAAEPTVAEDEIDLEDLIGRVLETRGYTPDRASKLDLLDNLGDSISTKIEEVFSKIPVPSSGEPATVNEATLLEKVGELIDSKLSAFTPASGGKKEKKKPLMQRMLGVSS